MHSGLLGLLNDQALNRKTKAATVSDDLVIGGLRQAGCACQDPKALAIRRSNGGGRIVFREPDDEIVSLLRARNEDREPFIESHFKNRIGPGINHGRRPSDLFWFPFLQAAIDDGYGSISFYRILGGGFDAATLEEHGQSGHLMPLAHVTRHLDFGNGCERFHRLGCARTNENCGRKQQGGKDWPDHRSF